MLFKDDKEVEEMKKNPLKTIVTAIVCIILLMLGPFGWIMGAILLIAVFWTFITEK